MLPPESSREAYQPDAPDGDRSSQQCTDKRCRTTEPAHPLCRARLKQHGQQRRQRGSVHGRETQFGHASQTHHRKASEPGDANGDRQGRGGRGSSRCAHGQPGNPWHQGQLRPYRRRTGNSEIILDRKLSDKRSFPAIDITKSGTRKEELLVEKGTLSKMWVLRRILNPMGTVDAMEFLLDKLKYSKTNNDFFDAMNT